ncbi:hypothetical protein HYC85_030515 [Camellia sinensis]|uniref:Transposase MuDR plant domain-containing protein n=1 Tax=Camellia sinensis TaxID=4442 RepID=A0A7J7G4T8_CAMSI|nr:hypothetical protein HYC85_030515 [Camellia sinensis]
MCGIHKRAASAHIRGHRIHDHCKVCMRNSSLLGKDWSRLSTEEEHKSDGLVTIPGSDDPHYTCLHNVEKVANDWTLGAIFSTSNRAAYGSVLAGCGSKPTRPALMRLGKNGPATARDAVHSLCGRVRFENGPKRIGFDAFLFVSLSLEVQSGIPRFCTSARAEKVALERGFRASSISALFYSPLERRIGRSSGVMCLKLERASSGDFTHPVFRHQTAARSVRVTPVLSSQPMCLTAFGNLGLLAGYGAKPIGPVSMDSAVLLLCKYGNDTIVINVSCELNFEELVGILCKTWENLKPETMCISYSIVGHPNCMVRNNIDFLNMLRVVCARGVDIVDVSVTRCSTSDEEDEVGSNLVDIVDGECDRLVDIERNSLSKFCSHQKNVLLSAGWRNNIMSVGQKFEHGVVEFRTFLCKYAIEVGFQFTYVKNDKLRIMAEYAYKESRGCMWRVHASVEKTNGFF